MNNSIRPVSDLRNNFAEISKIVHETAQPVFLTKNGFGDMVVLSIEAYENLQFESEVYLKLQEAEKEAKLTDKRFSSKEILAELKGATGFFSSSEIYFIISSISFFATGKNSSLYIYCTFKLCQNLF